MSENESMALKAVELAVLALGKAQTGADVDWELLGRFNVMAKEVLLHAHGDEHAVDKAVEAQRVMSPAWVSVPASLQKRDAWAYQEMTRDPIFLLQRKERYVSTLCNDQHREQFEDDGEYEPCDECITYWRTESVWLSREQGEAYGEAHAYNYRYGWRVYCLCAEGELAVLLRNAANAVGAKLTPQSPPRGA